MSVVSNNILAGASGQGGAGYEIERSLRFNRGDSAYLSRTPSAAGNRKTWTWSGWVKRSYISTGTDPCCIFAAGGSTPWGQISFTTDGNKNHLDVSFTAGVANGTRTTAQFRDPSAWYHIVVAVDTTQATASDRIKMYVNGVHLTDMGSTNYPAQNFDTQFNNTSVHRIGANGSSSAGEIIGGYLADIHLIDGQALAPTDFGETDTNGVWQPKEFANTYGTNGFHLEFKDNSSNAALGTDTSGNSNTWTVNNLTADVPPPSSSFTWSGSLLSGTGGSGNAGNSYTGSYFQIPAGTSSWDLHNETDGNTGFWFSDSSSQVAGHPPDQNGNFVALRNNGSGTASTDGSGFSSTGFPTDSMDGDPRWYFTVNRTTGAGTVKVGPSGTVYNFTVPTTGNVYFHVNAYGAYNYNLGYGDPSNQDSLVDTPTNGDTASDTGLGGEITGNYAVLNPLQNITGDTFSNGNLTVNTSSSNYGTHTSTVATPLSGKWYAEVTVVSTSGFVTVGIVSADSTFTTTSWPGSLNGAAYYSYNGERYIDTATQGAAATFGANDVIGIAYDADSSTVTFYKNGASQGTLTSIPLRKYFFGGSNYDAGGSAELDWNFGQRAFTHPVSGYKSLNTSNLSSTIADGSQYFDTDTWSGNSTQDRKISTAFSPGFVWVKRRSGAKSHILIDKLRGDDNYLHSDTTDQNQVQANLLGLVSDGYELGTVQSVNETGSTYVGWAWDAGSSTVSNTDGSITSQVRANPSAGFSIVTYTGTGANATFGHGLNAPVEMVIIKQRDGTGFWVVGHKSLGFTSDNYLRLDGTAASASAGGVAWQSTAPTSSVVSIGSSNQLNVNNSTNIAYCFAPVEGYSAMGSYTGNGSGTAGPFVYLGFKPAFLLIKPSSLAGNWWIFDSKREPHNINGTILYADQSYAEYTGTVIFNMDFLSNGFRLASTNSPVNNNGETFIYLAFAENPFKTARAR